MDAILDAVQSIAAAEPEVEAPPVSAQPDDAMIETQLDQEISTLWSDHVRLSAGRRATSKELRQIRARLAERLHEMKSLLSRPGRGGQWRSWLRERKIPRSTADRLVSRYAEALCGGDGNVLSEAIPDSPEDSAERLARSVWQRIGKLLTTGESILRFIGCFAEISGVGHEQRDEGLMVFNPVHKPADELPASAPAADPAPQLSGDSPATAHEPPASVLATDPTSQPSGETPAAVEEPAADTTATPIEVVQAPAIADAGASGAA
jgi:hypothetical protein